MEESPLRPSSLLNLKNRRQGENFPVLVKLRLGKGTYKRNGGHYEKGIDKRNDRHYVTSNTDKE